MVFHAGSKTFLLLATAAILGGAPAALAQPAKAPATAARPAAGVEIPYERFTLPNGLRVLVHTDRKAPVVAVGVWYHVGSKDEKPGRTGFAHLFEHLMFQGTENYKGEWFTPFERVGATDQNGTTFLDRTNYFQTVPTTALDMTLWLESDRMGHFIDSVDQAKLDEQRGVVQNEKRQGENRPYGRTWEYLLKGLFPAGHPYSWTTIGSMEDLQAASLEDVKTWFRTYYGPNNAVLVLAGDIDVQTAKPLVEKYFGDIGPGPMLGRDLMKVPDRRDNTRSRIEDRVPQPMLNRSWAVPGRGSRDSALLDLAAHVLGGGKTSRLYKDLVYDRQIATQASANLSEFELASIFGLSVMPKAGVKPEEAEQAMERVVRAFLEKGPTAEELERAKTQYRAAVLRGLEKVGGFAGKATMLAEGELYNGDPGHVTTWLRWIETATPAEVQAAAREWLGRGWHQVDVVPVPAFSVSGGGADRSALPAVSSFPDLSFPAIETATLSNGMSVSLARRTAVPTVTVALQFDAGYAADPADKPGVGGITINLMDEGTKAHSALALAADLEALGADLSLSNSLDSAYASIDALKDKLDPSLALLAEVVREPAFKQEELDRVRPRLLAGIQQEKANPQNLAWRLLPPALYGKDHAYGKPLTGSGTEAVVKSVTRDDLVEFHRTWIRPDNARIFVVGDTTLKEVIPALEKAFGGWKAPATPKPAKNLAAVKPQGTRVALIDRPDAQQSYILAGRVGPAYAEKDDIPLSVANDVIGGMFTARLNMNLREAKGWSYGVRSGLRSAVGQQPWVISAPVQTDKTGDALAEILKELKDVAGSRPATADEIAKSVENSVRSLPGQFETADAVLGQMLGDARYGRKPDYILSIKGQYEGLTPADVSGAVGTLAKTDDLLWVVVGDRKKIETAVRNANLGPVEIWDTDGNRLQ
ncbi:M16 family metallopeptidase [Oleisolibacter albus]|uniref:M16 family metallopeptidase n=1 Tax=Oleisolibacter albus TaxID=2171757 RepID=UPI000DF1B0A0|nr:pitrilysin family protein [Oleisolibacter albus]